MASIVRDRTFQIFLLSQALAGFGDNCLWLAMGIWVKTLTGSSAAAGMLFFAFAAPQLAGPFAGFIVDRVRLQRLLVATSFGTALLVSSLFFVSGEKEAWVIYAVMAASGAAATLLGPAQSVLLVTVVPREQLVAGNSALQTVRQGIRLLAPMAGAGLFAWGGAHLVVALDVTVLIVAGVCLCFLSLPQSPRAMEAGLTMASLTAGIRHIYRTRILRKTVTAATAVLTTVGFSETIVYVIADRGVHQPPEFVGAVVAAQGAGAIIGSVLAPVVTRRRADVSLATYGLLLFSVSSVALMSSSVILVLLGSAMFGQSLSWILIGLYAVIQRCAPPEIQGRVYSTADFLATLPQTGAIAIGALLITVVGYRSVLLAMALVALAAGGYLMAGNRRRTAVDPADGASRS